MAPGASKILAGAALAASAVAATWFVASRKPSIFGEDGAPLATLEEAREVLKQIAMVSSQVLNGLGQQRQQLLRMGQVDPEELRQAFLQEFVNQVQQVQALTLSKFPGCDGGLSEAEFDGLLRHYQGDAEIRKFAAAMRECYRKLGGEFTGGGIFAEDGSRGATGGSAGGGESQNSDAKPTGAAAAPSGDLDDIDDIDAEAASAAAPASGALTLDKCFTVFDAANDRMLEVFRTIKRGAEAKGLGMDSPEAMQQLMMAQAQSTAFVEEECRSRGMTMMGIQSFLQRPEHQMEMAQRLMASQEALQRTMMAEGLVPVQAGMGM